jgi:hypothetical protein
MNKEDTVSSPAIELENKVEVETEPTTEKSKVYSLNILDSIQLILANMDDESIPVLRRFSFAKMETPVSLYLGVIAHINSTFNSTTMNVSVYDGSMFGSKEGLKHALSCLADEYILDKISTDEIATLFLTEFKLAEAEDREAIVGEIAELESLADMPCHIFREGYDSTTCKSYAHIDPQDPVAPLSDMLHDILFETLDMIAVGVVEALAEAVSE